MAKTLFVTGTDTEVGKTLATAGMLVAFQALGKTTAAIKPVAAGAVLTPDGRRNEDGLILQQYQSVEASYQRVNPVLLDEPLSPHIAAARQQRRLTISQLVGYCRGAMMQSVDVVLIEGAGGWRVPLNARETLAALPRELNIPVVMVVGLRLGCLNHALLTAEAIIADGLTIMGWIANQLDPAMAEVEANLATLQQRLPGHYLGHVPWLDQANPEQLAPFLDLSSLSV